MNEPKKNNRYDFGNIKQSSTILNEYEGIAAQSQDDKGGFAVRDNFGNIRLIRSDEQDPTFEYQKKYNIQFYDDDGVNKAFISVMDNEVVNNLVEGWLNPTEKMLETRKSMGNEKDDGSWKSPTEGVSDLISDWKKFYPSISSGANMGGYIGTKQEDNTSYKFEVPTQKFKECNSNSNIKNGMTLACNNCGKTGITSEMNFCPHCGQSFEE